MPHPRLQPLDLPQGVGRFLYSAETERSLCVRAPARDRPGSLSRIFLGTGRPSFVRGRTALPARCPKVMRTHHHPKPVVIVEVGWVIVVAIGATRVPLIVVGPRPATQHPFGKDRPLRQGYSMMPICQMSAGQTADDATSSSLPCARLPCVDRSFLIQPPSNRPTSSIMPDP